MPELKRRDIPIEGLEALLKESAAQPYGRCLNRLRDRMNEYGFDITETEEGERLAAIKAREMRIKNSRRFFEDYTVQLDELPYTAVENGGKYRIYGVAHGYFFVKVARRVSDFACNSIIGGLEEQDAFLFYEQNLDKAYRSLKDKSRMKSFKDHEIITDLEYFGARAPSFPVINLATRAWTALSPFLTKSNRAFAKKVVRAGLYPEYIQPLRDAMETYTLPEPLDIACYCGSVSALKRTTAFRSAYMAQMMKRKAKATGKPVHALVGEGHESQIKYFLENGVPDEIKKELSRRGF